MNINRIRRLAGLTETQSQFDYGHYEPKDSRVTFGLRDLERQGQMSPNRIVNRQGDNPMVDQAMVECGCGGTERDHLDKFEAMLRHAGVSEQDVGSGSLQLTAEGMQKVARALGHDEADAAQFVKNLFGMLADEHNGRMSSLSQDYAESVGEGELNEGPFDLGAPAPVNQTDQYTYETDMMGNVTVRNVQTGKETYLQGSEAVHLVNQIEKVDPAQQQQLLSQYESVMESVMTEAPPYAGNEVEMDGVLERPDPHDPGEFSDRPVKFHGAYDAGARAAHGEFGRPMEPAESASISIIRAVDQETGQEYELSPDERSFWEGRFLRQFG